jgi:hypothetical protein
LDLFTGTTWEEFLAAGGEVSGFRERRWKTVQQMKPGDYLLCYLTGISRWIGVLEHRAVLEQHAEPTRQDDPDVARPAPLAANHRTRVRRPSPAWLLDRAADGQVAEVDQLLGDPRQPDGLVWSSEVLGTGLGHRHMLIPVAQRVNERWYESKQRIR